MTLSTEDLRFGVDDARRKHAGLVDLIGSGVRQSLSFLQLYIALGGTALSGAAVILLSNPPNLPHFFGVGLAAFGLCVAIAAIATLAALWPADMRLAGHDPQFWRWAEHPDVTVEHALHKYLDYVDECVVINRRLNVRMGRFLLVAKVLGAAAPIVGIAAGAAGWATAF